MPGLRSWLPSRRERVSPEDTKELWQTRPSIFWVKEFGAASVAPPAGDAAAATTPRHRVLATLRDFVDNSYISGVTLMGRRNIPLWDRLFWTAVVLTAAVAALNEIPRTYWLMYEHPSTVEVLSTSMELHSFPFPSVFVCPKMKIRKSLALAYIKRANRRTEVNESDLLAAMRTLQYYRMPYWLNRPPPNLTAKVLSLFDGIDLRHFMTHVAPDCDAVFHSCLWSGSHVDCCRIFRRSNSNTGLCFAFNSFSTLEARRDCPLIAPDERPKESGAGIWYFHRPNKSGCVLVRSGSAASGSGLEFFLRRSDLNDSVSATAGGYEVSVQAANENANMDKGVYLDQKEATTTNVKVTYSETTADPWMSDLDKDQRGCLFEDEQPRPLFDHISTKWYTQESCLYACRLAFLVERCGCYPYFIWKQDRQCTLEQYRCLINHNSRLFWLRVPDQVGSTPEERNQTLWPDCRPCRPMCSLSIYDADYETSATSFEPMANVAGYVNVFYRDLHSAIKYTERRDKEPTEVMMNYAAASNLLLGVSVMSVVQLVMYSVEVALALSGPLLARLVQRRRRWWRPPTPPPPPPLPFAL